jgi:hypothetical protein
VAVKVEGVVAEGSKGGGVMGLVKTEEEDLEEGEDSLHIRKCRTRTLTRTMHPALGEGYNSICC